MRILIAVTIIFVFWEKLPVIVSDLLFIPSDHVYFATSIQGLTSSNVISINKAENNASHFKRNYGYNLCKLAKSLDCHGNVPLVVLGLAGHHNQLEQASPFLYKVIRLLDFLEHEERRLPSDAIVCFLDAFDSLVVRSLSDFRQAFQQQAALRNSSILFSTERVGNEKVHQNVGKGLNPNVYAKAEDHWWMGLNSGLYCGYRDELVTLLSSAKTTMINTGFKEKDQVVFRRYSRFKSQWKMGLDVESNLYRNMIRVRADEFEPPICPLNPHRAPSVYQTTGARPYLVHFPGNAKSEYYACMIQGCDKSVIRYLDYDAKRFAECHFG